MARPRKPTATLERGGAFLKDPNRKRKDPPSSGALGNPPKHLSEFEREVWLELASDAPLGVLTRSDRHALAQAAYWVAHKRTTDEWTPAKDKCLGFWLVRLGMTPADRSKVNGAPEEKPEDPAADYLN